MPRARIHVRRVRLVLMRETKFEALISAHRPCYTYVSDRKAHSERIIARRV